MFQVGLSMIEGQLKQFESSDRHTSSIYEYNMYNVTPVLSHLTIMLLYSLQVLLSIF